VGGGLAALAGWQQGAELELVPLGAGIGAVVGFIVGGGRPALPEREAQPAANEGAPLAA
jgi:hypothetical protein